MKKIIYLNMLLICAASIGFAQVKNPQMKVLAYYSGAAAALDNYDVTQMTHIIFCFGAQLNGNRYNLRSSRDTATIQKMVSLKSKNPNLKVLLSLGGAGGCLTCSDAFSTAAGRTEFVQSVKQHLEYFKADGIDLDWEFPSYQQNATMKYSPDDVKNFTLLVKELKSMGPQYQVTFAVGAHKGILEERADYKEVMKYADFVNLMSYDIGIYPPSASIVEFAARQAQTPELRLNPLHVALYSTPQQERSVDFCIQYMLKADVPPEKIIVGAAFYGKVYTSASDQNNGLYQPGKRLTTGGSLNFKDQPLKLSADSGWVKHWDNVAMVPYAYNASKKLFVTYEDKRSVDLKAKYVLDHKLGGIMFWQLGGDTFTDGLLNTIDQVKKTYTAKAK